MSTGRFSNPPRSVRLLVGTIVLALAFIGGCLIIRPLFPFPRVAGVHAKLMHFREHANDYDTLFVGSSRINYQLIPSQFDKLAEAAGQPTKTFNAAVAGMRPPEDTYFFDQLLAARPQRLRWVFIELMNIRPRMNDEVRGTARGQYWHDLPRLWLIWKRITYLKPKKGRDLEDIWHELRDPLTDLPEHIDHFTREMCNLGKGEFLAQHLLATPTDVGFPAEFYLGSDNGGWTPTGRGEDILPQNRDNLEKEVAERLVKPAVHDLSDPVSQGALEAMIAKVERLGATPVLIVAPVTSRRVFYPTPERAQRTIVLDLNDPVKFPELYETRHRIDTAHLNTAGAEVFTRILAEQWTAALKARGLAR